MINESFSQSWNSDMVFSRDAYSSEVFHSSFYDTDFISIPTDICSPSQSPSVASSDCGDDFRFDFDSGHGGFVSWCDPDLLDTPLTELVDGNLSDWVVTEVHNSISTSPPKPPSPINIMEVRTDLVESTSQEQAKDQRRRRSTKTVDPFRTKKWSLLNPIEQLRMVEGLTHIISTEMTLREQLEIIRIIDPLANIPTEATEFAIDLSCLNDDKWQTICELVKQYRKTQTHSNNNSKNCLSTHTRIQSRKASRGAKNGVRGKLLSNIDGSSGSLKSATSKLKRENRQQVKTVRGQDRKQYRQMMKEHRSGLFKQEQILTLTSSPSHQPDDDVDIDILD